MTLAPQLFLDRCNGVVDPVPGLVVEGRQPDEPDGPPGFVFDRFDADELAGQREFQRLGRTVAGDCQPDFGSGGTAHLVDRILQRAAEDQFAVEVGDIVAGLDPGARCGRVVDRRDDLDRPVLDADRQAQPAIFARHLIVEILGFGGVHIVGMRIEAGEHAVDRAVDQLLVIDLVDIIAADAFEHVHQRVEFLVGIAVGGGLYGGRCRDEHQRDKRQGDFPARRHGAWPFRDSGYARGRE